MSISAFQDSNLLSFGNVEIEQKLVFIQVNFNPMYEIEPKVELDSFVGGC